MHRGVFLGWVMCVLCHKRIKERIMPKKITKKSSGRGMAYTPAEKRFLVSNVGAVLPVSKHGWKR
eukprot:2659245-Ditylum_brightwellii.AAC.1